MLPFYLNALVNVKMYAYILHRINPNTADSILNQ